MGNPKMRLSEIIPNAWFHNPKSTKTHHPITKKNSFSESQGELPLSPALIHPLSPPRKSYHFKREFSDSPELDTPRKASRRGRRRKPTTQKTSLSETFTQMVDLSSNSHKSRANSVVINREKSNLLGRADTGGSVSSVELPTIKIEREKFSDLVKKIGGAKDSIDENKIEQQKNSEKCRPRRANGSLSVNVVREESSIASPVCSLKEQGSRSVRRLPNGSPRVRIRIHSPRFARRAQVNCNRGSLSSSPSKKGLSSKSLAVVKSSSDPQKDFRESMVEMIVENNIRATKDLEELLACYLSLNSDQYHDLIIQVFTQIWFDLNHIFKQIKK